MCRTDLIAHSLPLPQAKTGIGLKEVFDEAMSTGFCRRGPFARGRGVYSPMFKRGNWGITERCLNCRARSRTTCKCTLEVRTRRMRKRIEQQVSMYQGYLGETTVNQWTNLAPAFPCALDQQEPAPTAQPEPRPYRSSPSPRSHMNPSSNPTLPSPNKDRVAKRVPQTLRQWCRMIQNPGRHKTTAVGPAKQLLRFFENFPVCDWLH